MPHHDSPSFQGRRALLMSLAPRYQQASRTQKTLQQDSFVEWTGYTRKYAIELLNQGERGQQIIQRRRPNTVKRCSRPSISAWKATHYVCDKRVIVKVIGE